MLCKNDLEDDIALYLRTRLEKFNPKIIFDVGSNVGWFTYQFAKIYPETKFYLFEPATVIFDAIEPNLSRFPEINAIERASLHRIGLGHENTLALCTTLPSVTVNRIVTESDTTEPTESVQIVRGDDFCVDHGITHIDFLKVDAEGYDLKVLLGFTHMLAKSQIDFIQVEASMDHDNKMHTHMDAFSSFLSAFNYKLFRICNQASSHIPYLVRADVIYISTSAAEKFSN